MTNETNVETKDKPAGQREYGFTILVKGDGNIQLTPHNLANDFEFAGLADYVSQKKTDLLKTIGISLETRTLQSVGLLAKALVAHEEAQEPTQTVD